MIKNLIFDLDDTIIKDELEDAIYYKEALRNCGYDENNYKKVYDAIEIYDNTRSEKCLYYNKQEMLKVINFELQTDYSINLIDELILVIGKYWTKRVQIKEENIKKLSEKYNLYIYTNFFTEAQLMRIKNIGYDKYFKKVFGADLYGCKPFKISFQKILDELNTNANECIMIGDSKNKDILAANNIGMKSILYDYNGKRDKNEYKLENYIVISDLNKLIEIL